MPNIFVRMYSHSALISYALVMFLVTPLAIWGDVQLERVVAAVGVGGFFIIAGDLLSQSYYLFSERYSVCKEFIEIYNIANNAAYKEVTDLFKDNIHKIESYKADYEHKFKGENIARDVGFVFTIIGFSFLLLLLLSSDFFVFFEPSLPYITIFSFFFLTLMLIRKEIGYGILEKIKNETECITKITQIKLFHTRTERRQ